MGVITSAIALITLAVNATMTTISEERRSQETQLQTYLDDLGEMLLGNNANNDLVRAKTTGILPALHGSRKSTIVRFLYDSDFIKIPKGYDAIDAEVDCDPPITYEAKSPVDLRGADLRGADLNRSNLLRADLSRTYLNDAILNNAMLRGANFFYTDLERANLSGGVELREANLACADLQQATLRDATLNNSDLRSANLAMADLGGAYLVDANLNGATNISNEYLEGAAASLKGATMPDGTKHE